MSSARSYSPRRSSSPLRSSSPRRSPNRSPQRQTGDIFNVLSDESILKVLHKLSPAHRQQTSRGCHSPDI